jgi:hypothetical protein
VLFNEIADLAAIRRKEKDEEKKSQMTWDILRKKQNLMRSMKFTDYINLMVKAGILLS